MAAIEAAVDDALAETGRPSLISVKTIIGFGSRDAGTSRAHSDARGPEQQAETKRALGFDPHQFFVIPEPALARYREALETGARLQREWDERMAAHPQQAELERIFSGTGPDSLDISWFAPGDGPMATRAASGKVIAEIAAQVPEMVGGSADLTPSTTRSRPTGPTSSPAATRAATCASASASTDGRHRQRVGGVAPACLRRHLLQLPRLHEAAVRLSALMNIPAIWIYTHDSVGLGEDGPTHQPVEQLATLRATPNVTVFRPADANETTIGWRVAMERRNPTALCLTRQALPVLDASALPVSDAARGGYVLEGDDDPDVILIATGSEVHTVQEARSLLAAEGVTSRVVSLPSWELP
jgi:transketolase